MSFFVLYDVVGFGKQKAGPYKTRAEGEQQRDDIQGFEGVHSVRLISEADLIQVEADKALDNLEAIAGNQ